MEEERVVCPLIDGLITPIECMENREIHEDMIPEEFKKKVDWQDICRNCKYYNY